MSTRDYLRAVLDTSSVIVLVKLGIIDDVFKHVLREAEIPRGVLVELERKKNIVYNKVLELIRRGLLKIEETIEQLPRLGLGESSTLLLALEKRKVAVLDDKRARRIARELGLRVIGSIALVKRLYNLGLLRIDLGELYIRLIEMGFYIKRDVFDKVFGKSRSC